MSEVLGDFIRALRASNVRVSTSEAIDASDVIQAIGYEDRMTLKSALGQVLAKSEEEKAGFSRVFDRFFEFQSFTQGDGGEGEETGEASSEQQSQDGEDQQGGEDVASGEGGNSSGGQPGAKPQGGMGGGPKDDNRSSGEPEETPSYDLLDILERGDQSALQMLLAQSARNVGLNRIRLFTQRGLYTRRIMDDMGVERVTDAIIEGEARGDQQGLARAAFLRDARERLREQVRDYVEKQLEIFTANAGEQLREEVLSTIRLSNVEKSDMRILRQLVRKMAKKLVSLYSRRRKVEQRGVLDARRTIRANIEYDGLLFKTVWKQKKVDRPRVMVICDVSGSVAQVSRFLLMFLYSLQEVLSGVRSFCFSSDLGEVTDLFERADIETAISDALRLHGNGSTDYGKALEDFEEQALKDVDRHTTVIILGDARSNNADPRADLLQVIQDRARQVLFLNPEPKSMWGTGDSEMLRLKPHVDKAVTCASLKDLERVVSDLLRHAA